VNSSFKQLLIRWLILALGVTLAAKLVDGISYANGETLLVVVLLLSFFNAILKPLLVVFTLPFILLTMGLGVLVINALLFLWVGNLVNGFHVAGFWAAMKGAIIVSLTNLIVSALIKSPKPATPRNPPPPPKSGGRGDVIDI
jgi:putative membrane protein